MVGYNFRKRGLLALLLVGVTFVFTFWGCVGCKSRKAERSLKKRTHSPKAQVRGHGTKHGRGVRGGHWWRLGPRRGNKIGLKGKGVTRERGYKEKGL